MASTERTCFRIKRLKKDFGTECVLNIDHEVEIFSGQITALLGYSGSGKSTLLNILSLLDEATCHESNDCDISFHSWEYGLKEYNCLSYNDRVALRRKSFGFVFQAGHLIENLTCRDNIVLPLAMNAYSQPDRQRRADRFLSYIDLDIHEEKFPSQLSGGQLQRVAVSRALAHDPEVIFADEPTGNLDPDLGAKIMNMLQQWQKKADGNVRSLIFVTHNFDYAFKYADRILLLERRGETGANITTSLSARERQGARIFAEDESQEEISTPSALLPYLSSGHKKLAVDNLPYDSGSDSSEANARKRESLEASIGSKRLLLVCGDYFSFVLKNLFPIQIIGKNLNEKFSGVMKSFSKWMPALLNILSITVLTVAGLVIGGLWQGIIDTIEKLAVTNPFATVIDISTIGNSRYPTITPGMLKTINSLQGNRERVWSTPEADIDLLDSTDRIVVEAVGWYDVGLLFFKRDGSIAFSYNYGRTVQKGEMLTKRLELGGWTDSTFISSEIPPEKTSDFLSSNDQVGLIVSSSLLGMLGYSYTPQSLAIQYNNSRVPIPVIGVVKQTPRGDFLLPEGFWQRYRDKQWNPDPLFGRTCLGPFPTGTASQIDTILSPYLNEWNISKTIQQRENPSEYWFSLELAQGNRWRKSFFEDRFFSNIDELLEQGGFTLAVRLEFGPPTPLDDQFQTLDVDYLNASIYLKNIYLIEPMVEFLQGDLGVRADNRVLERLKWLVQMTNFGRGAFLSVVAIIMVITGSNLFLAVHQNIHRKIREIGVLMAFGASRFLVAMLYLGQSILIWIIGTALGVPLSLKVGESAEHFLMSTFELRGELSGIEINLFLVEFWLIVCVLGIGLGVCIASTLIASHFAIHIQPAQAVRTLE
jgi:putative ABC transport system ATP-binding protein